MWFIIWEPVPHWGGEGVGVVAVAATVHDFEPLHYISPCWLAWAGEDLGSGGFGLEGNLASWHGAVSLFSFFWWECDFPVLGMGFFPCSCSFNGGVSSWFGNGLLSLLPYLSLG